MLVDTGLGMMREDFMATLAAELDPATLRWIWISHVDFDHVGNLSAVLEAAPHARVLTGFLTHAKMMLSGMPVDRVDVVAAGDTIEIGDRRLTALRPPYYDAPETLGFFDAASSALFVVDAYGAALPEMAPDAESIDDATLDAGLAAWSSLDAPWLTSLDRGALEACLASFGALKPRHVLTAHLPTARDVDALNARVMRLHASSQRIAMGKAA